MCLRLWRGPAALSNLCHTLGICSRKHYLPAASVLYIVSIVIHPWVSLESFSCILQLHPAPVAYTCVRHMCEADSTGNGMTSLSSQFLEKIMVLLLFVAFCFLLLADNSSSEGAGGASLSLVIICFLT